MSVPSNMNGSGTRNVDSLNLLITLSPCYRAYTPEHVLVDKVQRTHVSEHNILSIRLIYMMQQGDIVCICVKVDVGSLGGPNPPEHMN